MEVIFQELSVFTKKELSNILYFNNTWSVLIDQVNEIRLAVKRLEPNINEINIHTMNAKVVLEVRSFVQEIKRYWRCECFVKK